MKNSYYLLTLPLISLFSSNALATMELTDDLLFSAFGSTSITRSDNETPLYLNREITDENCFDCDTTLGVQLDYQFLDSFTASVQVVKRPQDEWSDPALEWLYIGYNYKQYDIKVGRLRIPAFLDSEYYYVAHAYTAARPSQEVYDSLFGVTSYDGLSIKWQEELTDDISLAIEPYGAFFGERDVTKGDDKYNFKISKMAGLHIELSSYDYRIFVNGLYSAFDTTLNYAGLPPYIPAFTSKLEDQTSRIYSLGGEYLWDAVTLRAETYYAEDNFNWYTQVAYSINKFTPYIAYAEKHNRSDTRNGNYTMTAGLRLDLTASISINLEYQKTQPEDYDTSLFGIGQFTEPFSSTDSNAEVVTLMVNFIM